MYAGSGQAWSALCTLLWGRDGEVPACVTLAALWLHVVSDRSTLLLALVRRTEADSISLPHTLYFYGGGPTSNLLDTLLPSTV